jgi:hypothetical protein
MIGHIWGEIVDVARFFGRWILIGFLGALALSIVLWLIGSNHAGHLLNADQLETFEQEAGRWLAEGWR